MYEIVKEYFEKLSIRNKNQRRKNKTLKEERKWIVLDMKKEKSKDYIGNKKILEEVNRKINEIKNRHMQRVKHNLTIHTALQEDIKNKIKSDTKQLQALWIALIIKDKNADLYALITGTLFMILVTVIAHICSYPIILMLLIDILAVINCGIRIRYVDDLEEEFKKQYPEYKELLLTDKKSLKKSLTVTHYQREMRKSQLDKIERKNYKLMKTKMNITNEEYRNVEQLKNLSSSAKRLPLSIEELKRYREMIVLYQTQNSASLQCNKMNGSFQKGSLYSEVIYDYTIKGVSKTKQMSKISK